MDETAAPYAKVTYQHKNTTGKEQFLRIHTIYLKSLSSYPSTLPIKYHKWLPIFR